MKIYGIDETRSKVNKNNTIIFNNFRISILNENLIRIEKSPSNFLDFPTQSIWYRDFPDTKFSYKINDNIINIKINSKEFFINTNDISKSYVIFPNGKKELINNDKNLKGTTRTLDMSEGGFIAYDNPVTLKKEAVHYLDEKILDNGVCSKNGVAVYDDSKSLVIKDGRIIQNHLELDLYVFTYGNNYIDAVKDLYFLSGSIPLLPKYVFGNWWSRYWPYSDKEYLNLMDEFSKKNIPLSVATIDMDWHYVDIENEFNIKEKGLTDESKYGAQHGWTGFTWNKKLFPNYKDFLSKLKKRGLKITLNLHPSDGIRWFEDFYKKACEILKKDNKTKEYIPFDFTDNNFIKAYFEMLNNYEKDGVDFWWIDWQQGQKSNIKGYDPLWGLNHFHFNSMFDKTKRPLMLSRYSKLGSHRYPLGFSGDTIQDWDVLKYVIYFTNVSTNIGYTFWSHDIGGHYMGVHDYELYVRWLQFALYNPILRLHSTSGDLYGKEPWNYKPEGELIATRILQKRAKLIPYIYTLASNNCFNGDPLIKPLYYKWDTENSYKYKYQYLFGNLIIAPIIEKRDLKSSLASKKIFLPSGIWTDLSTNIIYSGNKEYTINRYLDEIPVFANTGEIIYENKDYNNSLENPKELLFTIIPGSGSTRIYQDDGETFNYKKGNFAYTNITQSLKGSTLTIKIASDGDLSLIPKLRNYEFKLLNTHINNVKVNDKESNDFLNIEDKSIITLNNFDTTKDLIIDIELKDLTYQEYILPKIKKVLLMQTLSNDINHDLYNDFKVNTLKEAEQILNKSYLDDKTKDRIKEIMDE